MLGGYMNKVLRINLTTGEIRTEPLDLNMARKFLGGRGFASYTLYKELKKGIDPLGPENKLIMASGPLAGLFHPCSSKITFAAKSPLTGIYGDSNMGGHLAAELKYAGYDMVIFEGSSNKPVYIVIDDDKVEIRDASHLWGKGTIETEKQLKDELGDDFQIAVIGPAGENLVKVAIIRHDFGRESGRTGVGAVMGSKKIKAIAVRGTKSIPVADFDEYLRIGKEMFKSLMSSPIFPEFQRYGTTMVVDWVNEIGAFPTRNFATGYHENYKELNGTAMKERVWIHDKACGFCPIACGNYSRVEYKGKTYYVEGPEYETIGMIGGCCVMPSIYEVTYGNYVCDNLGLDTISTGAIIAFAYECYEKGIITKNDTNGLELRWGDIESFAKLAEMIAKREGIGNILAEGVKKAAESFGKDSIKFAMQVKGMEISAYESHWAPAMLLAYATCDIGAHHNRAWAITYDIEVGREKITKDKAERVVFLQHARPMFDALGVCRLTWVECGLNLEYYAKIYSAVTGWETTLNDLLKCAERAWNQNRLFAIREIPDFGRKYDYPPARWMEEPAISGPTKGRLIPKEDVDKLLDFYYEVRGWDKYGRPTPEKIKELELEVTE